MKIGLVVGAVAVSAGTMLGQNLPTCTQNPVSTFTGNNGTWTLSPGINKYVATVSGPISPDGSTAYPAKRGVIPVQFSLSEGTSLVTFQSIGSDGYYFPPPQSPVPSSGSTTIYTNDCSFLSYTPSSPLTLDGLSLSNLIANYAFTEGNCQGGTLRWSITFPVPPATQAVPKPIAPTMFIYYGNDDGSWTDCKSSATSSDYTANQSGQNMFDASFDLTFDEGLTPSSTTDLRYETVNADGTGGGVYVNWTTAKEWAEKLPQNTIQAITLVLDGGWDQQPCGQATCGDQMLTLGQVTVNGDAFNPPTVPVPASPVCNLPSAEIEVAQGGSIPDGGGTNSVLSVSAADTGGYFRVVDCKYMYNLDVSSLPGTGIGQYTVGPLINGTLAGSATFNLVQ